MLSEVVAEIVGSMVDGVLVGAVVVADSALNDTVILSVELVADEDSTIIGDAEADADGGDAALAGTGAVVLSNRVVRAAISGGSTVTARDDVTLTAATDEDIDLSAVGTGVGGDLGIAGSGAIAIATASTRAVIEGNDDVTTVVTTGGNVVLAAERTLTFDSHSGAGAAGVLGGIGASVAAVVSSVLTEAIVGNGAEIHARGQRGATTVRADRTAGGAAADLAVRGLALRAISSELLTPVSVAGSAAVLGGGVGSANILIVGGVTRAAILAGAVVADDGAHLDQSVVLLADHESETYGVAGSATAAVGATAGAAIDGVLFLKLVEASISGTVDANRDVLVRAYSIQTVFSLSGTANAALAAALAGAGGLHVVVVTTRAFVGSTGDVAADGSVVVAADDDTWVDIIAGQASLSAAGTGGAAVGAVLLDKLVEAFVAGQVTALGTRPGVLANTGAFSTTYDLDVAHIPGLVVSGLLGVIGFVFENPVRDLIEQEFDLDGDFEFIDLTPVDAPPIDEDLGFERTVVPVRTAVQGLSVTATSRDEVEVITIGLGLAVVGAGTLEISGAALISTNTTQAYVADGAVVNGANGLAAANQRVRIGAGSDSYFQALAGGAGINIGASVASVGAAVGLGILANTTIAAIGAGATVNARSDITVQAIAKEDVLAFIAGMNAGSGVGLLAAGGSFAVVAVLSTTQAFIGAGAFVEAGGNVLVSARADTDLDLLTGNASLGSNLAGVGVSISLAVIAKNTSAWIDAGATVDGKGNAGTTVSVLDGNPDDSGSLGTKSITGVAVQARSSENIFNLAGAGTTNSVIGIAGAITGVIVDSDTAAWIGEDAMVNLDATGVGANQTVSVGAGGDTRIFGLPINVTMGLLTMGLGLDLGIIDNDITARILQGAVVQAALDIEVHAVSRIEVDSFIANVGTVVVPRCQPDGVDLLGARRLRGPARHPALEAQRPVRHRPRRHLAAAAVRAQPAGRRSDPRDHRRDRRDDRRRRRRRPHRPGR